MKENYFDTCTIYKTMEEIIWDSYKLRYNIFKNNTVIHNQTRLKPILYYLWGSNDNGDYMTSSNIFKTKKIPSREISNYGDLRQKIYMNLELENNLDNKLFQNITKDKINIFLQEKSDYITTGNMTETENNFKENENLLRIIDMDVNCSYNNEGKAQSGHIQHICNLDKNYKVETNDETIVNCCKLAKNGMEYLGEHLKKNPKIESATQEIATDDMKCCHFIEYLRLIPESFFIMKLIFYATNGLMDNMMKIQKEKEIYDSKKKRNSYMGNAESEKNKNDGWYDYKIYSSFPCLILWDGYGIDYRDMVTNNGKIIKIIGYGIDDLEIQIPKKYEDNWDLESQIKENGRFKKQYKDFIKYHIHVYKEENINFFNFLGLHYKKDAYRFRSNNYLYPGTIDKFIIKNGKITQDGYDVFIELYKYHIKNEQHFNKDNMINESLYDDFHFDYKTLTTFYGNNNCSYVSMKLIYDLLNIEHNFEISDIVKFIITKLDVSYSVFEDENNINFDLPSILVKVLDSKK